MGDIQLLEHLFYSCFQDSKIGHLAKGIVHNLNGFMQILSMNIEMLKMDIKKDLEAIELTDYSGLPDTAASRLKNIAGNLQERLKRLSRIEKSLTDMEDMINIITNRSQNGEGGQGPVILRQVVEEELDFWNADLFFKHQIKKHLSLPDTSTLIVINEGYLRDLIDGLLDACIKQMRKAEERHLKLTLYKKNEAAWSLEFEHTGNAFPAGWDQNFSRYSPGINDYTQNSFGDIFLILALNLSKVRAEQIGGTLKIEPQKAVCLIPNEKRPAVQ